VPVCPHSHSCSKQTPPAAREHCCPAVSCLCQTCRGHTTQGTTACRPVRQHHTVPHCLGARTVCMLAAPHLCSCCP
jgi:hypothetical protein